MTPISQNQLKRNTYKLWTLIFDRDVSVEISDEFKSLVAAGVDVNLQDTNENRNTALHLAVEKDDEKCLKFLLPLKPNEKVVNENDETAEDLAIKLGHIKIARLLQMHKTIIELKKKKNEALNSTSVKSKATNKINSINFDFIKSWNIQSDLIQSLDSEKTLRVLRVFNFTKDLSPFDELRLQSFREFLSKSSHFFVIIIETDLEELEVNFSEFHASSRPLVIQVSKTNKSPEIYFKEQNSQTFLKLVLSKIDANSFRARLKLNCNFQTLLSGLTTMMTKKFDGNLLNIHLDFSSLIAAAQSAVKFDVLSLRFLQLFMTSTTHLCDHISIVDSMQFDGVGTLRTLLELPFEEFNRDEVDLNDWQKSKIEVGNDNQNELINEAVKENNSEALELLVKNFDISRNQIYAETAWKLKRFSCLSILLSHNSPFPESFNLNQIDHRNAKAISKILIERRFFIDAVQKGSVEDVEDFLD
jgi:hypothetical protein